jgi:hypothetical protein
MEGNSEAVTVIIFGVEDFNATKLCLVEELLLQGIGVAIS